MKKTLVFAMMAALLGFAACSKAELAQTEITCKGMVLHATVAQPEDTKATFTDNEGVWHFDFVEGDEIKVTNKEIGYEKFYTFTYDGEKFVSEDAEPTDKPTRWYAYFPSNEVFLIEQSGLWEDIADMYVMTGSTPDGSDVTGEDGLSIIMEPKVAILKIENRKGDIDINVLRGEGMWVYRYSTVSFFGATSSYDLYYKDTKQTLLSTTEKGTYYVAVPAGIPLTVYDGDKTIKSTSKGLKAGKYYELTILGPTTGYATVKSGTGIPDNKVKWIQLWEDGPKFAEINVGATSPEGYGGYYCWGKSISIEPNGYYKTGSAPLTGTDDTATNLWGENWRMPTSAELSDAEGGLLYECDCVWTTNYNGKGVNGLLCTGKDGTAFASNKVFFPAAGHYEVGNLVDPLLYNKNEGARYWTSTPHTSIYEAYYLYFFNYTSSPRKILNTSRSSSNSVRAVYVGE